MRVVRGRERLVASASGATAPAAGLGGIGSIRTNQEFNHVTICPHIAENMDFCKVQMKHPYGMIGVSWEKAGETTTVAVTIPPIMTATICTED